MAVHIYTPAQVTVPAHSEDHIWVVGGKVWDFSRFALVTPVVVARGAKAAAAKDKRCRCFEISFRPGSAVLSEAMKWRLLELPRDREIWVASGDSSLAQMRAQAVSEFLRSHGGKPVFRRLYRSGVANDVFVLTNSQ